MVTLLDPLHLFSGYNSISIVEKVHIIAAFAPKQKSSGKSACTNACIDIHAYFPLILIEPNETV